MATPANTTPSLAASDRVLILSGTVTGGASSIEGKEAAADGLGVDVVDAAAWSSMTAAKFASYRAIILGDPTCAGPPTTPDINAAAANAKTWGPVINGNVVVLGTDPVFHATQGGEVLTRRGIDFAVNQGGKTGAYISLSCYYHGTVPNTPVPVLDGIGPGGFTVTGVGCYNSAHIVAVSPALVGLADSDLSNWSCSVHEAFQAWPGSLVPLAIAKDFSAAYTASDGTQGPPYILAGGNILSFPLSLAPLSASGPAGTAHTVTATLLNGSTRAPVSGAKLGFSVLSGPNTKASGACNPATCLTQADGTVSWTYTSNGKIGTDTIQAFYDLNGNGAVDIGEPQTTAAMQWTPTVGVLAFGDSVAAGYGLGNATGQGKPNPYAYPALLATSLGLPYTNLAAFGACANTNGAPLPATYNPDPSEGGPVYYYLTCAGQPDALDQQIMAAQKLSPTLITLTVGANDIDFQYCLTAVAVATFNNVSKDPCEITTNLPGNISRFKQNLDVDLQQLTSDHPGVPIMITQYYNAFPPGPSNGQAACGLYLPLAVEYLVTFGNPGDIVGGFIRPDVVFGSGAGLIQSGVYQRTQLILGRLNGAIASVASKYSNVRLAKLDFGGHDMCQGTNSWVFGPAIKLQGELDVGPAFARTLTYSFGPVPGSCPDPIAGGESNIPTTYPTPPQVVVPFGPQVKNGRGRQEGDIAYSFVSNCLPHPTQTGQQAIAAQLLPNAP